jgi:hypothetical protein
MPDHYPVDSFRASTVDAPSQLPAHIPVVSQANIAAISCRVDRGSDIFIQSRASNAAGEDDDANNIQTLSALRGLIPSADINRADFAASLTDIAATQTVVSRLRLQTMMSDNQLDAISSAFAAVERLDLAFGAEGRSHLIVETKARPGAEDILRSQSASYGASNLVIPIVSRSLDLEPPLGLVDGRPVVAYGLMLAGLSADEAHVRSKNEATSAEASGALSIIPSSVNPCSTALVVDSCRYEQPLPTWYPGEVLGEGSSHSKFASFPSFIPAACQTEALVALDCWLHVLSSMRVNSFLSTFKVVAHKVHEQGRQSGRARPRALSFKELTPPYLPKTLTINSVV